MPGAAVTAIPPPPRLCFVAHFAYSALSGRATGHIGGVERQAALMSRWLAARGHPVTVVTWDEGQPDDVEIDGVRVVKVCHADAGVRGVRFVHPRWTSLARALRRVDADIYYQNCAEAATGQVALWCRWRRRRFVYSVASDAHCDRRLPDMKRRERVLYRAGLRCADRIIAQTSTQARMLRDGFGRTAQVIAMPGTDMSGGDGSGAPKLAGRPRVLWIGRLAEVKRPDRVLDLAALCPALDVDLVGPEDGTRYGRQVIERARTLPNVAVHGRATEAQIRDFLARALCLVSTSAYEGFPNTFLEAWSARVPVISTVDPDGVIGSRGLGGVAADPPGLAALVADLIAFPDRARTRARRLRRYFLEHHSVERVLPQFEQVFRELGTPAPRPIETSLAGGPTR